MGVRHVLMIGLLGFSPACSLVLLGEDEVAVDTKNQPAIDQDDSITDKHPTFVPGYTIDEDMPGTVGPCTVTSNKSGAVTKLDIVPLSDAESALGQALYPNYTQALAAAGTHPVEPTMELVNAAWKPFDDGLYAAVELGAEDGSDGSLVNKRQLLSDLLMELITRAQSGTAAEKPLASAAATDLGAAFLLGGGALPSGVSQGAASSAIDVFKADTFSSTPTGFYEWLPGLSQVFRQDRFLQSPDSTHPAFEKFAATAVALQAKPDLAARYANMLGLYAGMTNPSYDRPVTDLVPLVTGSQSLATISDLESRFGAAHPETANTPSSCAARLAYSPASDSSENRVFRKLYCQNPLPPGENLLDVLITQIRSGQISLAPTPTSGWYDRQIYALETLLVPEKADEKDNLFLTKRYKDKLIATFKTLLTETRETHVKQIATGGSVATAAELPPNVVNVYPVLPLEPFATFYIRSARAYAFVHALLVTTMGMDFMSHAHRVLEDGTRAPSSLEEELAARISLAYGLHIVAAKSLGVHPSLTGDEVSQYPMAKAESDARAWLSSLGSDADAARDPRVIVPLEIDTDRRLIIYSAVIGTKLIKAQATFYPGFEPTIVSTHDCVFGKFTAYEPYLAIGRTVQISRPSDAPPPTRTQLRALCDANQTEDAIVSALEHP